ncbi:Uncharacterized protein HZ326_15033 [Fusarium oxysporum f. sp. albedinis]|nr:Uncharacterized protein HZ326_15033 [Fusarium oxysporum f. sp. albedinis]
MNADSVDLGILSKVRDHFPVGLASSMSDPNFPSLLTILTSKTNPATTPPSLVRPFFQPTQPTNDRRTSR